MASVTSPGPARRLAPPAADGLALSGRGHLLDGGDRTGGDRAVVVVGAPGAEALERPLEADRLRSSLRRPPARPGRPRRRAPSPGRGRGSGRRTPGRSRCRTSSRGRRSARRRGPGAGGPCRRRRPRCRRGRAGRAGPPCRSAMKAAAGGEEAPLVGGVLDRRVGVVHLGDPVGAGQRVAGRRRRAGRSRRCRSGRRCRRAGRAASARAMLVADPPGPPGLTNRAPTRSSCSRAGIRTTARVVVGPPGSSWSSGTATSAHSMPSPQERQRRSGTVAWSGGGVVVRCGAGRGSARWSWPPGGAGPSTSTPHAAASRVAGREPGDEQDPGSGHEGAVRAGLDAVEPLVQPVEGPCDLVHRVAEVLGGHDVGRARGAPTPAPGPGTRCRPGCGRSPRGRARPGRGRGRPGGSGRGGSAARRRRPGWRRPGSGG